MLWLPRQSAIRLPAAARMALRAAPRSTRLDRRGAGRHASLPAVAPPPAALRCWDARSSSATVPPLGGAARRGMQAPAAQEPLGGDVWAELGSRAVVQVKGPDCVTFLQGLTTNDMRELASATAARAVACAFLNPQGRVLYDALVRLSLLALQWLRHAGGSRARTESDGMATCACMRAGVPRGRRDAAPRRRARAGGGHHQDPETLQAPRQGGHRGPIAGAVDLRHARAVGPQALGVSQRGRG